MEHLGTQDYMGARSKQFRRSIEEAMADSSFAEWHGTNDDDEDEESSYPFPLVMKTRQRSDSLASAISGTMTPSGGRRLTEKDLLAADEALSSNSHVNGSH